jgi:hypothetical protein
MSFIIQGHPDWKKGHIKIFNICHANQLAETKKLMHNLVISGRLPITPQNINLIVQEPDITAKSIINENSQNAGLTLIGIREEMVKHEKEKLFEGYDKLGTVLFVHSKTIKFIG